MAHSRRSADPPAGVTALPAGEPLHDTAPGEPAVRGFLHRSPSATAAGLVLTHGAGSDCNAPLLVALAVAFAAREVTVLRCDLPYRQARRTGPPDRDRANGAGGDRRSRPRSRARNAGIPARRRHGGADRGRVPGFRRRLRRRPVESEAHRERGSVAVKFFYRPG